MAGKAAGKTMRAVVVAKRAPGGLAIRDVAAPTPAANEALVRVKAISLNRGETRRALSMAEEGWRPGWDLAGVVERAAADGSGPKAGSRVVGMVGEGSWAELVAVPSPSLAVLPDKVSFEQAATLPVAGLTALHALSKGGQLLGRPVLIGGASGGVGTFALQLAHLCGAYVVAPIRDKKQSRAVQKLGADVVAVGPDLSAAAPHGPYHLILESVGGASLAAAMRMLAPGGTCVLFGVSGASETSFDAREFFRVGGARLYGLILFDEITREPAGVGLAQLAQLIAAGKLEPKIEVEAPWSKVGEIAGKLIGRQFVGKAVLTL